MAAMAKKNWADVDEDDDEVDAKTVGAQGFQTGPDENGIIMRIEYVERDGKTYKVLKRFKQHVNLSWTNDRIEERKSMEKFGKVAQSTDDAEKKLVCEEDVVMEFSKKLAAQAAVKDEAEDKFYEESLAMAESMNQQKKAWTASKREEVAQIGAEEPPQEKARLGEDSALREQMAERTTTTGEKSGYLPPALRGKGAGGEGEKGKGKGMDSQEVSLRITNLSDDAREGDLWDLFGAVGRLSRVHLAKDPTTGMSRGFAFISYYNKEDAQKAIDRLHGHGYDNLIMQVQFAKPRV